MQVDIEHNDDICILRLKGRFATGSDRDYLSKKAGEIRSRNCVRVVVDFREVPYIDSTGIGFVVGLFTNVTKNPEGRFVLVGPHPRVKEVLRLTRLDTIIQVAIDMDAGYAYLQDPASSTASAG